MRVSKNQWPEYGPQDSKTRIPTTPLIKDPQLVGFLAKDPGSPGSRGRVGVRNYCKGLNSDHVPKVPTKITFLIFVKDPSTIAKKVLMANGGRAQNDAGKYLGLSYLQRVPGVVLPLRHLRHHDSLRSASVACMESSQRERGLETRPAYQDGR